MIDIEKIVIFLLAERVIGVIFMVMVLVLQIRLFGKPINFDLVPNLSILQQEKVYMIRRVLFGLSLTIFLGNMIPIAIDWVTLFSETSRPDTLSWLSIGYGISNATTDMVSGFMIWVLYKLAGFTTTK